MNSEKKSENLIYLTIWVIVLALPVFTLRGSQDFNWSRVILEWIRIIPFLVIFIINNNLLAPKLLFNKMNLRYLAVLTLTIIVLSLLFDYTKYIHEFLAPGNTPRPGRLSIHGLSPLPDEAPLRAPRLNGLPFWLRVIDRIIFSYLVVGFNTAVKFVFKRQVEEQKNEEQKKIHIQTELSFLRQQIGPHFFMNTLNNIHALVDIDAQEAKGAIIRLSNLMAYMLYGTQADKIPLQKEMDFVKSYVELMRIRFTEDIDIRLDIPETLPTVSVPPLLTISFIENAFKHGISYEDHSFVHISYHFTESNMFFEIQNSMHPKKNKGKNSGIGLENSKSRLNLIFADSYDLKIVTLQDDRFSVKLNIPI
jgi:hypothetical protein